MKTLWTSALAPVLALGLASQALAADPATLVQARQGHFKEIGKAMKGLTEELKTPAPSLPKIQGYAKRIDALAPQVPSWFPAGTGPDSGVKTHAKADIWKKPDDFKNDSQAFAVEAHKLDLAAASGDMAALRMEAAAVGKTCGACHKAFREKED